MIDFNEEVIVRSNERPVVVNFGAKWCGPCKIMKPVLSRFSKANEDNLDVVVLDVDTHIDSARKFEVRSIPTILLFIGGEVVSRYRGGPNERSLEAWFTIHTSEDEEEEG